MDKIKYIWYTTCEYFGTPCFTNVKPISPKGGVKMKKYEIMFIVKPDLEEANINAVANNMKEVLKSKGATIIEEKAMGQRELAYEIQKYKTGYYFLYVIEAEDNEATKEFDRIALINENVIRHLIVKVEER